MLQPAASNHFAFGEAAPSSPSFTFRLPMSEASATPSPCANTISDEDVETSGDESPENPLTSMIEVPAKPSPFSEPDKLSDVVFIVEEKKLHFNKALLSMSSPVFEKMLFGDFAEKDAKEIPLPGKLYSEVVAFFTQIHPAYVLEVTDDNLLGLLALSREYQVESVRSKCQQYLEHMTDVAERDDLKGIDWTTDRLLLYVFACGDYDFQQFLPRLVRLVAKQPSEEITECDMYISRPSLVYLEVLQARCVGLEEQQSSSLIKTLREILASANSAVSTAGLYPLNDTKNCSCKQEVEQRVFAPPVRRRECVRQEGNKCCSKCAPSYLKNTLISIANKINTLGL